MDTWLNYPTASRRMFLNRLCDKILPDLDPVGGAFSQVTDKLFIFKNSPFRFGTQNKCEIQITPILGIRPNGRVKFSENFRYRFYLT